MTARSHTPVRNAKQRKLKAEKPQGLQKATQAPTQGHASACRMFYTMYRPTLMQCIVCSSMLQVASNVKSRGRPRSKDEAGINKHVL